MLKARLEAARKQPKQDISAFLCDIRTIMRRAYRTYPLLAEQIVITSFMEHLSDLKLRWELRKSKPTTADGALALAMELNSFLEIEEGASITSKVAKTSVNAISCATLEPSTKKRMDELVRTSTEGFKNAMPEPSQEASRPCNSTADRNQFARPNSTDSQGNRTVYFQKHSKQRNSYNGGGSNRRELNLQKWSPTRPNSNKTSSKGPCKQCKRSNYASIECKAYFKCGKKGYFRNECRSNTSNNLN